jgi:hypothetical protein
MKGRRDSVSRRPFYRRRFSTLVCIDASKASSDRFGSRVCRHIAQGNSPQDAQVAFRRFPTQQA